MARAVPFHKRFPGRHAVSALIVLPSGARVDIAAPFDAEPAELVLALLQSDTTGERTRQLMEQLRLELQRVAAFARATEEAGRD